MNVGLVNEYYPPFAVGGAEWSSQALATALARDHEVRVVTPNYGAPERETIGGVSVYRFPSPVSLAPGSAMPGPGHFFDPAFYRRTQRALLAEAARKPFDLLHVQNKHSLPGAQAAARRLGIPVAYTLRDLSILCPAGQCLMAYDPAHPECGRFGFWWRVCRPLFMARHASVAPIRLTAGLLREQAFVRYYRRLLARVDGVIGVSRAILGIHRNAGLQTGRRSTVISNPAPAPDPPAEPCCERRAALRARYGIQPGPVVLYAGKFSPGKGTQVLADAAGLVARPRPDAQVLFAGEGTLQLPAAGARVLGRVAHDDLLSLYPLADVVVIPSVVPESMSRVGLEAMAAGRPLVGTRIGGTPEQIDDGTSGLLVPRSDAPALAAAILRLLNDDGLRRSMGEAGRRLAATRFSADAIVAELVEFYRALIRDRRGEGR